MHIVWQQRFRAFATEQPRVLEARFGPPATNTRLLCDSLSHQQWPFCRAASVEQQSFRPCRGESSATGPQNTLQLVAMTCAYTDGGANHKGALYDARRGTPCPSPVARATSPALPSLGSSCDSAIARRRDRQLSHPARSF